MYSIIAQMFWLESGKISKRKGLLITAEWVTWGSWLGGQVAQMKEKKKAYQEQVLATYLAGGHLHHPAFLHLQDLQDFSPPH